MADSVTSKVSGAVVPYRAGEAGDSAKSSKFSLKSKLVAVKFAIVPSGLFQCMREFFRPMSAQKAGAGSKVKESFRQQNTSASVDEPRSEASPSAATATVERPESVLDDVPSQYNRRAVDVPARIATSDSLQAKQTPSLEKPSGSSSKVSKDASLPDKKTSPQASGELQQPQDQTARQGDAIKQLKEVFEREREECEQQVGCVKSELQKLEQQLRALEDDVAASEPRTQSGPDAVKREYGATIPSQIRDIKRQIEDTRMRFRAKTGRLRQVTAFAQDPMRCEKAELLQRKQAVGRTYSRVSSNVAALDKKIKAAQAKCDKRLKALKKIDAAYPRTWERVSRRKSEGKSPSFLDAFRVNEKRKRLDKYNSVARELNSLVKEEGSLASSLSRSKATLEAIEVVLSGQSGR